jgi:hypothetical protein
MALPPIIQVSGISVTGFSENPVARNQATQTAVPAPTDCPRQYQFPHVPLQESGFGAQSSPIGKDAVQRAQTTQKLRTKQNEPKDERGTTLSQCRAIAR